jgi:hypothetical protein
VLAASDQNYLWLLPLVRKALRHFDWDSVCNVLFDAFHQFKSFNMFFSPCQLGSFNGCVDEVQEC